MYIYICIYVYIYIYRYLKMNLKRKGHKSIHRKAKLKLKGVQVHENMLGNMTSIFYSERALSLLAAIHTL